jgi:hypothetical protein
VEWLIEKYPKMSVFHTKYTRVRSEMNRKTSFKMTKKNVCKIPALSSRVFENLNPRTRILQKKFLSFRKKFFMEVDRGSIADVHYI